MLTKRLQKVAKELQKELSQIILYEMSDPRVGFVTITKVTPAPDLKDARVFVSVIGDEGKQEESVDCLNHASGYIQKTIGCRLKLRETPKLIFVYDKSIEKQFEITKIIEQNVNRKDKDHENI